MKKLFIIISFFMLSFSTEDIALPEYSITLPRGVLSIHPNDFQHNDTNENSKDWIFDYDIWFADTSDFVDLHNPCSFVISLLSDTNVHPFPDTFSQVDTIYDFDEIQINPSDTLKSSKLYFLNRYNSFLHLEIDFERTLQDNWIWTKRFHFHYVLYGKTICIYALYEINKDFDILGTYQFIVPTIKLNL